MTDYKQVADYLVEQTQLWFERHAGFANLYEASAVIGISGGKDSSVVASILCKALSPKQVYGVLMPDGSQPDIQDSRDLCKLLGIKSVETDIENAFDTIVVELDNATRVEPLVKTTFGCDKRVTTNLPARLRMCMLYAVANHINARVIGTGNYSEAMLGYTSIFGDSACDFNPIGSLYVDEVIAVGEALGLPEKFTRKPPSDGMCGKTDEENLGFTYDQFKQWDIDYTQLPDSVRDKIAHRVNTARFKRKLLRGIPVIPLYRYGTGDNLGGIDLELTKCENSRKEAINSLY